LYRNHFAVLVLMRPTKEVLLAAGFLVRRGDVSILHVAVAAMPLLLPGVWLFYFLGQAYSHEIRHARLPSIAGRLLPADRIKRIATALRREGPRFIFLGRLAAFPSSLVAAAAGIGRIGLRPFVAADAAGALTSVVLLLGLGYALGEAYDEAGRWVTALGVAALFVLVFALGRRLRRRG
jgi:membrane protein DedA with SNARE-associated domain